jgi:hypothetical protein
MPHERRGPRGDMPLLGPQELTAIWGSVGVDVGVHAPEHLVNKRQRHMHAAWQKFSKVSALVQPISYYPSIFGLQV